MPVYSRPVERGVKGESFPGPHDVWGIRHHLKILKRVFQIHFGDPAEKAHNAPQTPTRMVKGHPSPRPPSRRSRGISILAHMEWGCDIGPRDNGFLGPAVAHNTPGHYGVNNAVKR